MEFLDRETYLKIEKEGRTFGKVKYVVKNKREVLFSCASNISLCDRDRQFSLISTSPGMGGLTFNVYGGLLGWRKVVIRTRDSVILGVIKSSPNFLGLRLKIEDVVGYGRFTVKQVLNCNWNCRKFEVYSEQDVFAARIIQNNKQFGTTAESYTVEIFIPLDAAHTSMLLSCVFFLEDNMAVNWVFSTVLFIFILLLLCGIIGASAVIAT